MAAPAGALGLPSGVPCPKSCRATGSAVILFGYIGMFLVLGVSAAFLVVVADRASDRARLCLRCLLWGLPLER